MDKDNSKERCRLVDGLDQLTLAEAFDFASAEAADSHSNSDRSLDSNTPNKDCFADRTNIGAAVSWAEESLEGLHNDNGEMENFDH